KVLTILNGNRAKAYHFSDFQTENVLRDLYGGNELLLVGDQNFITVFALDEDTVNLAFEYAFAAGNGAIVLTDNEGHEWNVF
ncbi:hypothetical protein, partial [Flagellimonas flava]|uniref:hypothetical protein n=1 Tax=Flagellimonas flava TaxID=570519 RepID=UPI003D64D9BF